MNQKAKFFSPESSLCDVGFYRTNSLYFVRYLGSLKYKSMFLKGGTSAEVKEVKYCCVVMDIY